MTTPVTKMTDDSMRQLQSALEEKVSGMITSGQTIERISEEIQGNYISGAGQVFTNRVEDWVTRYKAVMHAVQELLDHTTATQKIMSAAEDDAGVIGGNWGASDGIYSALGGK